MARNIPDSLAQTRVHLVVTAGDNILDVWGEMSYAEALDRISLTSSSSVRTPKGRGQLDIISVETGRFLSWSL